MALSTFGTLTPDDVAGMDYNQLIGVVRETNRPPGGLASVHRVACDALLTRSDHVLEIGTSTGFTAIELGRLVGCQIRAIDINPVSLAEARARAEQLGLGDRIVFEQKDATVTGYPDASFDLVFCGNVTSLIHDRDAALREYARVLKPDGFLAAIPMYYRRPPAATLLRAVSKAIHVEIAPLERSYWMDFFAREGLTPYRQSDFAFDYIEDLKLEQFTDQICARAHLQELRPETREVLVRRYREFMRLFRENLSHMGFTVMLLRKEPFPVDAELFTSRPVAPA